MTEIVREELESQNIRVQGDTQLLSGRCDQDPVKDGPPPFHCISSARARFVESAIAHEL